MITLGVSDFDNYFCRIKGTFPGEGGDAGVSFCTPNTQQAIDRFRVLKGNVNRAAVLVGATGQLDAQDPNLDDATFNLMVQIARVVYMRLADAGKVADVPPALVRLAQTPTFQMLPDNLMAWESLYRLMADGKLGAKGIERPTPPRAASKLKAGAPILLASTGLLALFGLVLVYDNRKAKESRR